MISTKDLSGMPDVASLRRICRAVAVLEMIAGDEEWLRRYFYHPNWDENEEVFEFSDGSEQQMLVLFRPEGCVISGVDCERYDWDEDWPSAEDITAGLPAAFHEFMYGEPVKSIKSTFCIWCTDGVTWQKSGAIDLGGEDGSEDMLEILDGNPQTYARFCRSYYEKDLPLAVIESVYRGEKMTPDMVKALNSGREDVQAIREELEKLGYPNTL